MNEPTTIRSRSLVRCAVVLCFLLCALAAPAQSVRLAWDASVSPGVTNYVLYAATNTLSATNLSSAVVKVSVGTNLTATADSLKSGRWWFAATAVAGGAESGPSNILVVDVPEPPVTMRTIAVQYSFALTNGWQDLGFFRLKIQ